jgi:hypothetical protein
MKLRLLFRVLLVVSFGLAAVCTITVTPAGAIGPFITVTPDSGLIDGQVVTITASGYTFAVPDVVEIEECTPTSLLTASRCDASTLKSFSSSVDDFSTSFTVKRHIVTSDSGMVDCGVPLSCYLVAANVEATDNVSVPMNFKATLVDLSILRARSIRRVNPGDPVEVRVRAANEGPAPTTWEVDQTIGPGLAFAGESCHGVTVVGSNDCLYSPTSSKVGHAIKTVFSLYSLPGFAGPTTDQVCVRDENLNDADPNPSNNCMTVSVTVR